VLLELSVVIVYRAARTVSCVVYCSLELLAVVVYCAAGTVSCECVMCC
jgi:hypothetical protein